MSERVEDWTHPDGREFKLLVRRDSEDCEWVNYDAFKAEQQENERLREEQLTREQQIEIVRRTLAADDSLFTRWVTWGYPSENDWDKPRGNCQIEAIAALVVDALSDPKGERCGVHMEQGEICMRPIAHDGPCDPTGEREPYDARLHRRDPWPDEPAWDDPKGER